MAHGYLRTPPQSDGRPDPLADRVIHRAIAGRLAEIKTWLSPRVPGTEDSAVIAAVTMAARAGGADGFRMSVFLKNECSWPADMALALLMRDVTESLALALRIETAEWAMRTGFRFPAKSNDQIVWADHNDKLHGATVISVDNCYASALVQPFEGLVKAGEPRRVLAERVVSNITTDEHAVAALPLQEAVG